MRRRRPSRERSTKWAGRFTERFWIAEVLSAGICGFIAALALIPASYAARGYFAFGGEWLIVLGVTLLAFHVINNAFFKMLKDH